VLGKAQYFDYGNLIYIVGKHANLKRMSKVYGHVSEVFSFSQSDLLAN